MQKIDHLIDGKAVAGTDYFETVTPPRRACWPKWPPAARPK